MNLPKGTYPVLTPPSWGELTKAIREAPTDDTDRPLLQGVELGAAEEDELAQRRIAMGERAIIAATLDLTVMTQHWYPDSKHVVAENQDVLVKFEPTDPKDSDKPAGAQVVPLDLEDSPEVWRGSVPRQHK